jgi:hypothetical protein
MHICIQEVMIIGATIGGIKLCWHWLCAKWNSR